MRVKAKPPGQKPAPTRQISKEGQMAKKAAAKRKMRKGGKNR